MGTIGRRGWIGIAIEATAGVPVTPASYLPFVEADLQEQLEILSDKSARGVRDSESENSAVGKQWGIGNIKVNLDTKYAPYFIGLALGTFGTATNRATGVNDWTFTRNASNVPLTASITYDRVVDRQLFTYAVVDSAEVSFAEGLVEVSSSLLTRMPVTTTSGTLTTTSGNLFAFRNATIQVGASVALASVATPLQIKDFKLKIENDAECIWTAGSATPTSIISKSFKVSGSYSLLFENTTQRDAIANLTKQAMIITLTGNGIGGGYTEFIKFNLYKIRYDKRKTTTPLDDLSKEDIEFVAEYSSADTKTIDINVRTSAATFA